MKKIVWTYGLIAGGIVSVGMFFSGFGNSENMDMGMGETIGFTIMFVAFFLILFGIKAVRDKVQDGIISFGKAFKVGLFISFIASSMYVASWMIISNTYATDFIKHYTEHRIEDIQQSEDYTEEKKAEKIENALAGEKLYDNQLYRIGVTYAEILPVGLLLSLIFALIFKRKDTELAKRRQE